MLFVQKSIFLKMSKSVWTCSEDSCITISGTCVPGVHRSNRVSKYLLKKQQVYAILMLMRERGKFVKTGGGEDEILPDVRDAAAESGTNGM